MSNQQARLVKHLTGLKRQTLQKYAKKHGVKANLKTSEIIDLLSKLDSLTPLSSPVRAKNHRGTRSPQPPSPVSPRTRARLAIRLVPRISTPSEAIPGTPTAHGRGRAPSVSENVGRSARALGLLIKTPTPQAFNDEGDQAAGPLPETSTPPNEEEWKEQFRKISTSRDADKETLDHAWDMYIQACDLRSLQRDAKHSAQATSWNLNRIYRYVEGTHLPSQHWSFEEIWGGDLGLRYFPDGTYAEMTPGRELPEHPEGTGPIEPRRKRPQEDSIPTAGDTLPGAAKTFIAPEIERDLPLSPSGSSTSHSRKRRRETSPDPEGEDDEDESRYSPRARGLTSSSGPSQDDESHLPPASKALSKGKGRADPVVSTPVVPPLAGTIRRDKGKGKMTDAQAEKNYGTREPGSLFQNARTRSAVASVSDDMVEKAISRAIAEMDNLAEPPLPLHLVRPTRVRQIEDRSFAKAATTIAAGTGGRGSTASGSLSSSKASSSKPLSSEPSLKPGDVMGPPPVPHTRRQLVREPSMIGGTPDRPPRATPSSPMPRLDETGTIIPGSVLLPLDGPAPETPPRKPKINKRRRVEGA